MSRWGWAIGGERGPRGYLLAVLLSCQSTRLSVHVAMPGELNSSQASVRLLAADDPVCTAAVVSAGTTDPLGRRLVVTEACGRVRVVVSRRGRETVQKVVDTCEVQSLEVVLNPVTEMRAPRNSCERVLNEFLNARGTEDAALAASFWVKPAEYAWSHPVPWRAHSLSSVVSGSACRVQTVEFYEAGCELSWGYQLSRSSGDWRIVSTSRTPAPSVAGD